MAQEQQGQQNKSGVMSTKTAVKTSKFEGKKVKPNDSVKIKFTASKFHKDGAIAEVHPVQAEKFVNKGVAEYLKNNPAEESEDKTGGTK